MTKLNTARIRYWLFVGLIVFIPLSKYPSIALPAYNFSSFRVDLYQLLALIFIILAIWPTLKTIKLLYGQNRSALISSAVLAAVTIFGIFFSLFKSRSLLLGVSILFLIILAITGWWYVRFELDKTHLKKLIRALLIAGIVYGILGFLEFLVATFYHGNLSIMCLGCRNDVFGFPRINLFAAEPQFLANALLPFFFIALGVFYKTRQQLAYACMVLSALAIGLTFSRGAYFAMAIGTVGFFGLLICAKLNQTKFSLKIISILVAIALVGFGLQVLSASYRYSSTPNIAYNTVRSSLEHLSLGLVSLPEKRVVMTESTPVATPTVTVSVESSFESPGLIEASTDDRLGAASLALKAWRTNYKTLSLGVGAGNLGPFVNKNIDASAPNNLTVYIYHVLILAELGVVGLIAFLVVYLSGLVQLIKTRIGKGDFELYAALSALMVTFLVHYFFFGTYINTMYVWLFAGIVLGLAVQKSSNKPL
jgi:hypothetical protein